MSASEKLKALDGEVEWRVLREQIVAVVEAAQDLAAYAHDSDNTEKAERVDAALAALDEALS
ncbi:MAG: hypothetical protein K0S82_79 [Gaiellaceae bacterium]|nr:hypothetical protein [Gaiellaceae bacterium]